MGNRIGFVYVIQIKDTSTVKIGHSLNPQSRLTDLRVASPYSLSLIYTWEGTRRLEKYIHHRLAQHRLSGEWFDLSEINILESIEQIIKESGAVRYARVRQQPQPRPLLNLCLPPNIECHRTASGVSFYERVLDRRSRERGGRKYRGYVNGERFKSLKKLPPDEQREWIASFIRNYKEKKGLLLNPDGA